MRMQNCGRRRAGVSFRPRRPDAPRRGLEEPAPSPRRGSSNMRRSGEALWGVLRDARLRLDPQDDRGNFRRGHRGPLLALVAPVSLAVLIALLPGSAATADDRGPMVS